MSVFVIRLLDLGSSVVIGNSTSLRSQWCRQRRRCAPSVSLTSHNEVQYVITIDYQVNLSVAHTGGVSGTSGGA